MFESIAVNGGLLTKLRIAVEKAVEYEAATGWKRKLGITAEVGEILACKQLGLKLLMDVRTKGYDAIDRNGKQVQIKTRRSESESSPKDTGRLGSFSGHPFDYALLVVLDRRWLGDRYILGGSNRRDGGLLYFQRRMSADWATCGRTQVPWCGHQERSWRWSPPGIQQ